ncbi:hypothetical protein [Rubritalea profundi]|uniref:Uncharacterized protein n=1 Tax=Rubritalea profundi TaxID=1658618 RepID=A0A2S7TYU6_9BACT|nr:hypothetical protein [Rubritalea profundi]PQJ27919.1 hypothetical protein BSZ32_04995 [Rubritalea profundi]
MSNLLDLKRELLLLKQQGRKFISLDHVVDYCDLKDTETNDDDASEARRGQYEHDMELWREGSIDLRESARVVNESAFHALRTLVIVAGGSSAALLAFLGSIWTKADSETKASLADGLAYFGGALIGASLAYGLTYLTLLSFHELDWNIRGSILRGAIIFLVVACYISLCLGVRACYVSII